MEIYCQSGEVLLLITSMRAFHYASFGFTPYGWKKLSDAMATLRGTHTLGVKAEGTALLSRR
jgi:hypothetical protein